MLTAFAIALLAGLVLTPTVRRLALRLGLIDRPDGHRKLHGAVIPLGGGVVVLAASLLTLALVGFISDVWRARFAQDAGFVIGLASACVVICLVGLLDDKVGLRGRQKLVGQFVAAGVLVAGGFQVNHVELLGCTIELGLLAVPCTLLWLLVAINAVNLMDGMDGLASGLGILLSLTIAGMAYCGGHTLDGLIALSTAGALIGFLRINLPPAKMFLGDAGSMLIGLTAGALALRSTSTESDAVMVSAAVVPWAVPLFDVAMAILRRKLTGRTIYATDRCHLHHCLLRRGFSRVRTLVWIGAFTATTCCAALGSVAGRAEWLALVGAMVVLGALVGSGFFGAAECLLAFRRLKGLLISLWPDAGNPAGRPPQLCMHLQGTHCWEPVWHSLTEFAERYDLHSIQFNLALPFLHEEYHAAWERGRQPGDREIWSTDLPLAAAGLHVGRLKITGTCPRRSVSTWMNEIVAGLEPIEARLAKLIDGLAFLPANSPLQPRGAGSSKNRLRGDALTGRRSHEATAPTTADDLHGLPGQSATSAPIGRVLVASDMR